MNSLDVIVIGGSAGALDALAHLLPELPEDFPLPVVIVLHVLPTRPSHLAETLGEHCALEVVEVEDKMPMTAGRVFVAPPNYHLLIERNRHFSLSVDEPVAFSRPSIDVLFESAADSLGPRVVGVLLSGANEDGVKGLAHIRQHGGVTFVQDPLTAVVAAMPEAAIREHVATNVLMPKLLGQALAAWGGT